MKKGHFVSTVEYLEVLNVVSADSQGRPTNLHVKNLDTGLDFNIRGVELTSELKSADEFDKTETVTRTELAKRLTESYNKVFSVCFDKKDGTQRVLRGRLESPEPLLGRSHCTDLDVPRGEHRLRLVDHRTLHWMIIDGVKYEVK